MRRIQWFSLASIAGLLAASLVVCAPTLRLSSHLPAFLAPLCESVTCRMELGLDLDGGIDLLYQVKHPAAALGVRNAPLAEVARNAREVIADRIDGLGVLNPSVVIQGEHKDQIRVQVPAKEPARHRQIKDIIGTSNLLQFNEVVETAPSEASLDTSRPGTMMVQGVDSKDPVTGAGRPGPWYLLKREPELTGDGLDEADVAFGELGEPSISFRVGAGAAERFAQATARLVGKPLAIVLGGRVYMAAVVENPIRVHGKIAGRFDLDEARRVVRILRSGVLPAELHLLAETAIGPTLGADTVRQGLEASLCGGAAVACFMVAVYGVAGLLAVLAMLLNFLLQLVCLVWVGATLTLPGIAGFALTMGMAVDSNILVFERVREESAGGKGRRAALDAGYDKAFWTIVDSHLTSIITGAVLYNFGTGPIRGFAVTLIVGLVVNLFTSLWVTRVLQESCRPTGPAPDVIAC